MSSGNVKELARAPDADVIARLEEILESARKGEIIGFAIMCNQPGGYWFNEAGYWLNTDLLMAIEVRKQRIMRCYE